MPAPKRFWYALTHWFFVFANRNLQPPDVSDHAGGQFFVGGVTVLAIYHVPVWSGDPLTGLAARPAGKRVRAGMQRMLFCHNEMALPH